MENGTSWGDDWGGGTSTLEKELERTVIPIVRSVYCEAFIPQKSRRTLKVQ